MYGRNEEGQVLVSTYHDLLVDGGGADNSSVSKSSQTIVASSMATAMDPKPERERLTFIDVMRGYAILMMLQGHTVNVALAEKWRDPSYPVFAVWYYMTGLTAPTFFFAAGFIFAFLMARGEEKGGQRLQKGFKRFGSLMVLGWVFHLKPPFFKSLLAGDFGVIGELFGRSHILHVIGLSLLIMILLWLFSGRKGTRFTILTLVGGQAAFLLGPLLTAWSGDDPNWLRPVGTFLSRSHAYFPLFPWSGYALHGAAIGVLAWEAKWYRDVKWFGLLAIIGIFMKGATGLVPEGSRAFYWRGGEVLILLGLVGSLCLFFQKKNWEQLWPVQMVAKCGQETLTIFCLHIIVLYGAWFGIGLAQFHSKALGPWQTVGTALLVEIGFIALALNLPKLRKGVPPLRLLR